MIGNHLHDSSTDALQRLGIDVFVSQLCLVKCKADMLLHGPRELHQYAS